MYSNFEFLREFHVEISSRCNAACPMCSRNILGGATKPDLKLADWSNEFIPKAFDKRFKNLRNVMFCGTHGDPATAPQSLDAVQYLKDNFNTTVEFFSNGSTRNPEWWRNLGGLLQQRIYDDHYRSGDIGIFSIDGLEDTNHLYRRQTDWNTIMANAEAYIGAGGRARWDFIVFRHNQHQVEDAKALAKKMGFKHFRIRKTARFNYSPSGPDKWPVLDRNEELEYYIHPTSDPEYYNQEIDKFEELKKEHGSAEAYFDIAEIDCHEKNKFQRTYINAYGHVHPCCYTGNDIYPSKNNIAKDTLEKVFNIYEEGFNDLNLHTWDDILNHEWFNSQLEKSWQTNLAGGKLMRCSRTCGHAYKPITTQSHQTSLV